MKKKPGPTRLSQTNEAAKGVRWPLDTWLLSLLILLLVSGLFILYSASNQDIGLVIRQGARILVGLVAMGCIACLSPSFLNKVSPFLYTLGIGLLIAVLILGVDAKGAQRWLAIPGLFRFQPSELMKLATPLLLVGVLTRGSIPPRFTTQCFAFALAFLPFILIVQQPDLGTALLVGYSGFLVILFSGLSYRFLALCVGLSLPVSSILWFFMKDYQKQRVMTLFSPESDPLGAGWNIIQSKAAIGSGGIHGKGYGEGTQSQLDFLPESSTDFIIAVVAEEFGFRGILMLFGLYLCILIRCFIIAWNTPNAYGKILVNTLSFTFFIYIFVNVGMVSGILPVVGVPLPLVSYGGTSIVTLLAGFGVIMSIHTYGKRQNL